MYSFAKVMSEIGYKSDITSANSAVTIQKITWSADNKLWFTGLFAISCDILFKSIIYVK